MNAIQKLKFIKRLFLETYNDYPQEAVDIAKSAIERNLRNDNKCGTLVGKNRAQQIANKENLSIETIKRIYSYISRAEPDFNEQDDPNSCASISFGLWGGKPMGRWAENKLKELNLDKEFLVLPTPTGSDTEQEFIGRCMGDKKTINEFPDEQQRLAVCYSQWKN
jgi:hypothetical protein